MQENKLLKSLFRCGDAFQEMSFREIIIRWGAKNYWLVYWNKYWYKDWKSTEINVYTKNWDNRDENTNILFFLSIWYLDWTIIKSLLH